MRIDIITVLPEMIEGLFQLLHHEPRSEKGHCRVSYTQFARLCLRPLPQGGRLSFRRLRGNGYEDRADRPMHFGAEGRTSLRRGHLHFTRWREVRPEDGKHAFDERESHHSLRPFQRDRLPASASISSPRKSV